MTVESTLVTRSPAGLNIQSLADRAGLSSRHLTRLRYVHVQLSFAFPGNLIADRIVGIVEHFFYCTVILSGAPSTYQLERITLECAHMDWPNTPVSDTLYRVAWRDFLARLWISRVSRTIVLSYPHNFLKTPIPLFWYGMYERHRATLAGSYFKDCYESTTAEHVQNRADNVDVIPWQWVHYKYATEPPSFDRFRFVEISRKGSTSADLLDEFLGEAQTSTTDDATCYPLEVQSKLSAPTFGMGHLYNDLGWDWNDVRDPVETSIM